MEYLPLTKTLALGRPYALGTLLLASVYQAMSKNVFHDPYHKVGGFLWFVHMWLFVYFPELSDREPTSYKTLGLHVAHSLSIIRSYVLLLGFDRLSSGTLIPEA